MAERIFRGFLFLGRRNFFVDFVAGFFLLIFFVEKSAQKNPPGKSPAKSSKIYTTKIPDTFLQSGRAKITKESLYKAKFLGLFSCKKGPASGSNITKKIFWWNYFCNNYKDYYKRICSKELFCNNFGQDGTFVKSYHLSQNYYITAPYVLKARSLQCGFGCETPKFWFEFCRGFSDRFFPSCFFPRRKAQQISTKQSSATFTRKFDQNNSPRMSAEPFYWYFLTITMGCRNVKMTSQKSSWNYFWAP